VGVKSLTALPLFPEEKTAFILDVHVAIAANAAWLPPDRVEDQLEGLQQLFPFWGRSRYPDRGINHLFIALSRRA
jgi:hypothetical protein